MFGLTFTPSEMLLKQLFPQKSIVEKFFSPIEEGLDQVNAAQNFWIGLSGYVNEFLIPYLVSVKYFNSVETSSFLNASPIENIQSLNELLKMNFDISSKGVSGSFKAINTYADKVINRRAPAFSIFPFYPL